MPVYTREKPYDEGTIERMAKAMNTADSSKSVAEYEALIYIGLEAIDVKPRDIWGLADLNYTTCDGYCQGD